MRDGDVIETTGDYRLVVGYDDGADEPYGDNEPVVQLGTFWDKYRGESRVSAEQRGDTSSRVPAQVLANIAECFQRDSDGGELLERYLQAATGATVVRVMRSRSYQGGDAYVAFDAKAWRDLVGIDVAGMSEESLEAYSLSIGAEWQAFLDGEVYRFDIERGDTWRNLRTLDEREEWVTVDGLGPFYGARHYAEEDGRGSLEWWVENGEASN